MKRVVAQILMEIKVGQLPKYTITWDNETNHEQAASILTNLAVLTHRKCAEEKVLSKSNIVDLNGKNFQVVKN